MLKEEIGKLRLKKTKLDEEGAKEYKLMVDQLSLWEKELLINTSYQQK